eukprot:jgi/Botrbrau1/17224/Bobra.0621s0002.1
MVPGSTDCSSNEHAMVEKDLEFAERRARSSSGETSRSSESIEKRPSSEAPRLPSRHVIIPVLPDEEEDLMEPVPEERRLTLSFCTVSASVPLLFNGQSALSKSVTFARTLTVDRSRKASSTKGSKAGGTKGNGMRRILWEISGTCKPGEVLALMGPSGSGKTSLLSILGGRVPGGVKVDGEISYNGAKLSKSSKRHVGFVLQDDLLYENLTVYETLYYAAMLRLPRTMTREEKIARVEAVIDTLGLRKCKDTIIGGFFRRGISGGERKRVSVGHELLINPALLLLDEPTSGLDSTTAMRLVTTLSKLAQGGRSIISTIHQPSSRLFYLLDKLLLLSEGHAMYYGQADKVAEWFHSLGFVMPYGVNAADFILDLASGDVQGETLGGEEGREFLIMAYEQYTRDWPQYDGFWEGQQVPTSAGVYEAGSFKRRLSSQLDVVVQSKEEDGEKGKQQEGAHTGVQGWTLSGGDRWGASYWTQLVILFTRTVRNRRFDSLSTQDILQPLVLGLLSGLFWWQVGRSPTVVGAANVNGLIFFALLFLAFTSMFVALFTFPSEFKMMLKERASGMYRLSAFYFARTASDIPMEFTVPIGFLTIIYFMAGLRLTPGAYFGFVLVQLLSTFVAQSAGLLIGATVMDAKTAQMVASILMLTLMLVGGFYVNNIPAWIAWMKYLSFIYYGYNLLLKVQFAGSTLYDCKGLDLPNPATDPRCTVVPPGGLQGILKLQENTENPPWEVAVLIGYAVVLRAGIYVALRHKTSSK